jgi:uncharacterized protein (TIGR02611 family)
MPIARILRRGLVLVAGLAVLLAGVAMLVLPGPGVLVMFAGLSLLATEFTWAARLLRWAKTRGTQLARRLRRRLPRPLRGRRRAR